MQRTTSAARACRHRRCSAVQIGGCRSARCLNAAATSCACALRHARTVVKVLGFCCIAQHRLLRALRHALTVTCLEAPQSSQC